MLKMPFTLSRKKPEPTEPMSLESKKVVLREKRIEDALDDYTWRVDDELAKLDATRPLNMAYNDFLRYSQEEIDFPSSRSKRFGIDDLTGKHIGNCMYYDIDTRRHETELGIMIGDRAYWSKGYGTDAVDTLLKYIFTQTNMKRVYLHTLDGLSADQASAQARLGLHPDGDTTPRMGGDLPTGIRPERVCKSSVTFRGAGPIYQ